MTLRVNRRRGMLDGYAARLQAAGWPAHQVGPDALLLHKAAAVDALPGFADGLVSIQDAGAQRAAQLLLPLAGERILDACAAPGGKTAHLLEVADIVLLAQHIAESRTRRIVDNLRRLGLAATVKVADCREAEQW